MEELLARHRKQQKDLQGKITQKKKTASKKTRKGVNDECESLECDLKEKQQAEIKALDPFTQVNRVEHLDLDGDNEAETVPVTKEPSVKRVNFDGTAKDVADDASPAIQQKSKKPNRQKARLARRAADQEAQAAAAAEEAADLPNLRDQEMKAMRTLIEQRGLKETFIQPDGHCLYSACAHGLDSDKVIKSGTHSPLYQNVRYATANFISKHADDFTAFLEEPLEEYVKKIKETAEWGGQLELQAISRAYHVDINILQADGRVEKIECEEDGDGSKGTDVWLAYYRHNFGLGEHYNALTKADNT
jgi:OTU domain-containing protein 6